MKCIGDVNDHLKTWDALSTFNVTDVDTAQTHHLC